MPDTTVEQSSGGPYDEPLGPRVSRLEDQMSDLKPILARIEAILPHLATAAQVAALRGDIDQKLARLTGESDTRLERFTGAFDTKLQRFTGEFEAKLERFAGEFEARLERFAGDFNARLERVSGNSDAKLERFAGGFNARLERLTGRVEALPTTWQMMTAIIAGQVTLAGLLCAAVFGAGRMSGHW